MERGYPGVLGCLCSQLAQESAPGSSVPLANGALSNSSPTHQLLANCGWEWKWEEFFLPLQALRCFPKHQVESCSHPCISWCPPSHISLHLLTSTETHVMM